MTAIKILKAISSLIQAVKSTVFPLKIVTTSLPNGSIGKSYSSSIKATGGTLPYFEKIISGSLPPGLKIDGESQQGSFPISGTPTQTGSFTFTVKVTDSSH